MPRFGEPIVTQAAVVTLHHADGHILMTIDRQTRSTTGVALLDIEQIEDLIDQLEQARRTLVK